MQINRKQFIINGLGTLALAGVRSAFGDINVAWGAATSNPIVVVFLRGACDGLNLLTPLGDKDRAIYEAERPNLKLATTGRDAILKLNEPFGLHPNAKGLHELYKSKNLAFVHACGLQGSNRSHFDSQLRIEQGAGPTHFVSDGWISRYLAASQALPADLSVATVGSMLNTSLLGCSAAIALENPGRFELTGPRPIQGELRAALRKIYAQQDDAVLHTGASVLAAIDRFEGGFNKDYTSGGKIPYPDGELSGRLKTLAQLLKLGEGLRVATIDMGGWDTHKYQGTGTDGRFAQLVDQLSQGIQALWEDCSTSHLATPTIIVMTEFGRRLKENANRGTDHGHGGLVMVLGKNVHGGKVFGPWPGLSNEQLFERADLAIATDYRTLRGEILSSHSPGVNLSAIVPNFSLGPKLGLMA